MKILGLGFLLFFVGWYILVVAGWIRDQIIENIGAAIAFIAVMVIAYGVACTKFPNLDPANWDVALWSTRPDAENQDSQI